MRWDGHLLPFAEHRVRTFAHADELARHYTTLVHELGHQVHFRGGHKNANGKTVKDNDGISQLMEPDFLMPTAYSGTNIWEQFAENFVHYIFNPKKLKTESPSTYYWIEEHLENGLNRNAVPPQT